MPSNSKNPLLRQILISMISGIASMVFVTLLKLPYFNIDELITRKSLGMTVFCAQNKINLPKEQSMDLYKTSNNQERRALVIWIIKNKRNGIVQNVRFDDKNRLPVINCFTSSLSDPFNEHIVSTMQNVSFVNNKGFQLNNMMVLGSDTALLALEKEVNSDDDLNELSRQIKQNMHGGRHDYPIVWGNNRTPVANLHLLTDIELHESNAFFVCTTFFATLICLAFIRCLPDFCRSISSNHIRSPEDKRNIILPEEWYLTEESRSNRL